MQHCSREASYNHCLDSRKASKKRCLDGKLHILCVLIVSELRKYSLTVDIEQETAPQELYSFRVVSSL